MVVVLVPIIILAAVFVARKRAADRSRDRELREYDRRVRAGGTADVDDRTNVTMAAIVTNATFTVPARAPKAPPEDGCGVSRSYGALGASYGIASPTTTGSYALLADPPLGLRNSAGPSYEISDADGTNYEVSDADASGTSYEVSDADGTAPVVAAGSRLEGLPPMQLRQVPGDAERPAVNGVGRGYAVAVGSRNGAAAPFAVLAEGGHLYAVPMALVGEADA